MLRGELRPAQSLRQHDDEWGTRRRARYRPEGPVLEASLVDAFSGCVRRPQLAEDVSAQGGQIGVGIGRTRRCCDQADHVAVLRADADGTQIGGLERIGHLLGPGLALPGLPPRSVRDLAAGEGPVLGARRAHELAHAVVVGVGQAVPGQLIDVGRVHRGHFRGKRLDAAGDEQGGCHAGRYELLQDRSRSRAPDGQEEKIGLFLFQIGDHGCHLARSQLVVFETQPVVCRQPAVRAQRSLQSVAERGAEHDILQSGKGRPAEAALLDERHQHRHALLVFGGAHGEDVRIFRENAADGDVGEERGAALLDFASGRVEDRLGHVRAGHADHRQQLRLGKCRPHIGDQARCLAPIVEETQLHPAAGDAALPIDAILLLCRQPLESDHVATVVAFLAARANEHRDADRRSAGGGCLRARENCARTSNQHCSRDHDAQEGREALRPDVSKAAQFARCQLPARG